MPNTNPAQIDVLLFDALVKILRGAQDQGLDLMNPITLLALQLLGPVIALVLEDSPRVNVENLITLAESLNLESIRRIVAEPKKAQS